MKHEKWSCPKCSHKEYDLDQMRVAGSFWTKIFNIQNIKYTTVSCTKAPIRNFLRTSQLQGLQMYLTSLPTNYFMYVCDFKPHIRGFFCFYTS